MDATVNVKQLLLFTLGVCLIGFGIGFICGKDIEHSNTVVRAKSFGERETYSRQDMEVVIFGEIQK